MPSFSRHGDFFVASLITGPSSAMVRVRFTDADQPMIDVKTLAPDIRFGNPDESCVRDAVIDGVACANSMHSTSYKVAEIEYACDNDGKCALIRRAAFDIVERLATVTDVGFASAVSSNKKTEMLTNNPMDRSGGSAAS